MPKLILIADDLTGALDSVAAFAERGATNRVIIDEAAGSEIGWGEEEVVGIDAGTRHLSPEKAADIVQGCARRGIASGAIWFFKKADSTLRGNIGAELNALRLAAGNGRLAFAPAYPAQGRTTMDGIQYVNGIAAGQTSFAADVRSPVRESRIKELIRSQADVDVCLISTTAVREKSWRAESEGIYVFDARSQADLQCIAREVRRSGKFQALGGSAGFAAALAPELGWKDRRDERQRMGIEGKGPVLAINGSVNPVALDQAKFAAAESFRPVRLRREQLLAKAGFTEGHRERVREMTSAFDNGDDVMIQTAQSTSDVLELRRFAEDQNLSDAEGHDLLDWNLARIVCEAMRERPWKTLLVSGGDTLKSVAAALGWDELTVFGELAPGIVRSRAKGIDVISKAGGFGSVDFFVRIRAKIRGND